MTDHPRFEPVRNAPDQAHLDYNGGRLVDSVLKLVGWWRVMRRSARGWSFHDPANAEGTVGRPTSVSIKSDIEN